MLKTMRGTLRTVLIMEAACSMMTVSALGDNLNQEQRNVIRGLFDQIDKDGDNNVQKNEYENFIVNQGVALDY